MAIILERGGLACNPPAVAWQKPNRHRSNNPQLSAGTGVARLRFGLTDTQQKESIMERDKDKGGSSAQPDKAPVLSGAPERELELKLKKNPQDPDAKADVGSDESMDASDPIAATQPGGGEPAPSSGFPDKSK